MKNQEELTARFARLQYQGFLKKELFRKSIHICAAFVPFMLKANFSLTLLLLLFAIVFYGITQILRLRGIEVPVISFITDMASRRRDENKFVLGPITLACGILLVSLLWYQKCPKATVAGIWALAFGDGLASLSGKAFGRVQLPFTIGKTLEGSATCFFAIMIATFCLFHSVKHALILALVGTFIEMLPLKDFDNVLIPLAVSTVAALYHF